MDCPFRADDGTCKPPYFRQICFMICLRSPEISTLRRRYCFCFCCYRCYRIELLHELSRRLVTGLRSIREPLTSSASMNPGLILGCVDPFRLEGNAFSGRQLLRIKFSHFDRLSLKRWTNLSLSLSPVSNYYSLKAALPGRSICSRHPGMVAFRGCKQGSHRSLWHGITVYLRESTF